METVVYSRFNRNIFTQNSIWKNQDKLDTLVFKVTLVCGIIGLFLPWGGQA